LTAKPWLEGVAAISHPLPAACAPWRSAGRAAAVWTAQTMGQPLCLNRSRQGA